MLKNKKFPVFIAVCLSALALLSACRKEEEILPPREDIPEEEVKIELPSYYPFTSEEIKQAYENNNDVTGWLTIPDCEIDNQVFIGVDNNQYLRLDEEGNYDVWGCYFMDYRNVNDGYTLTDKVSVIYGHSWLDSAEYQKFSKLKLFRDRDFCRRHPVINYSLLYNEITAQIFAVSNIPVTIDYIDPNPREEKYQKTLDYLITHSFVDFDVEVSVEDKILLLSTCTSDGNTRFVVAAKIV